MPKMTNTRDHKARELFAKVQRGPLAINDTTGCKRDQYNLWVSTGILPQLIELIPQLRKDPPAFQLMSSHQPAQEETQLTKDYNTMTVLELQREAKRRGLALTNLRDYKRVELTQVLRAEDRKEIETVRTRYPDARVKMSGMDFVVVTGVDGAEILLSQRRDTPQEAWEEAAEDVRRLNREERQQRWRQNEQME